MTRADGSHVRTEDGQALVEAAMTLLVFLVFLFAIFEGGRMLHVQQSLTDAARMGARYSVLPLQATNPGTLPTAGAVQTIVRNFLAATHITVPTSNITVNQAVTIGTTTYSRVTVTYAYTPMTLRMFNFNLTLTGMSLMRNETSP